MQKEVLYEMVERGPPFKKGHVNKYKKMQTEPH